MHTIDRDIVAKSEELHPKSHNYYDAKGYCLECENSKEYCECLQFNKYMRTAYQQGAMDERRRINEEISKIESWITENRPHLAGLGALTAMLKQVKAVETLPI
jgi:hypothetical protein